MIFLGLIFFIVLITFSSQPILGGSKIRTSIFSVYDSKISSVFPSKYSIFENFLEFSLASSTAEKDSSIPTIFFT